MLTKTNKEKDVVLFLFNDLFVIATPVPRKKKMALKINSVMELTNVIHSAPHSLVVEQPAATTTTPFTTAGTTPPTANALPPLAGALGGPDSPGAAAQEIKKECTLHLIDNSVCVERGIHRLLFSTPQERDSWAQALQEYIIDVMKKESRLKKSMGTHTLYIAMYAFSP